ncbi:MAG: TIGR02147 family protein [Myxococcota bacterium]
MTERPDLFTYLDYRLFLDDWFAWKKQDNARYSHRAFARRAGQKSPSFLKGLIEGRRNITPATLTPITAALDLDSSEANFFAALVQLEQADTDGEQQDAWDIIAATKRFLEARRIEGEGFAYLTHWYYPAIRELARIPGFRTDPEWIRRRVHPGLTPVQVQSALESLKTLGLLVEVDGRLESREATIVTPHEVAGLAVHNYHYGMLDRAKDAIRAFDPDERHFLGITATVPRSLLPTLKAELNAVTERLSDLCDSAKDEPEEVVQINLNFFPLTARFEETS